MGRLSWLLHYLPQPFAGVRETYPASGRGRAVQMTLSPNAICWGQLEAGQVVRDRRTLRSGWRAFLFRRREPFDVRLLMPWGHSLYPREWVNCDVDGYNQSRSIPQYYECDGLPMADVEFSFQIRLKGFVTIQKIDLRSTGGAVVLIDPPWNMVGSPCYLRIFTTISLDGAIEDKWAKQSPRGAIC